MDVPCNFQCAENKELQEKIALLEQQLALVSNGNVSPPLTSSPEQSIKDEYVDELRKKIQSQVGAEDFTLSMWMILYRCNVR